MEEALDVLQPYLAGLMVAYEVSTRVNSVKNNEPSLIEPVSQRRDLGLTLVV
jgi:putative SOS response-associated peptidase YedK